jgi:hypothetical protein
LLSAQLTRFCVRCSRGGFFVFAIFLLSTIARVTSQAAATTAPCVVGSTVNDDVNGDVIDDRDLHSANAAN